MKFTKILAALLLVAGAFTFFLVPQTRFAPILLIISSSLSIYHAYVAKRSSAADRPFDRKTLRLF